MVSFHASSRKSNNLHFDGLLLSKAYKFLDEKVQKIYVSWHWRLIQRKETPEKYPFLCDTIDLKPSVEGTLKLQGKSLTTDLDDVHFIVNPYSFPLLLVTQANSSFPKVCHFPCPLSGRITSNTPPLPKISPNDTSFHISTNSPGLFLYLQNACWFFLKMCGKNVQVYWVHIPIKCIDSRHFYSCPSPLKTRP